MLSQNALRRFAVWTIARDVVERVAAAVALERADHHRRGRQDQEHRGVGEERDDAEPGERGTSPAGRWARPENVLRLPLALPVS